MPSVNGTHNVFSSVIRHASSISCRWRTNAFACKLLADTRVHRQLLIRWQVLVHCIEGQHTRCVLSRPRPERLRARGRCRPRFCGGPALSAGAGQHALFAHYSPAAIRCTALRPPLLVDGLGESVLRAGPWQATRSSPKWCAVSAKARDSVPHRLNVGV